jgi:4-hydroxy-4-methyl-2-oxoglutarate aldolase
MALSAMNRGVVRALIDGACRDVEEIRRIGFPVVSKGVVPNVGSVSGYGHVNVPIQCGGVVVNPGDTLIVDGNGVVAIPKEQTGEVLGKTR